MPPSSILLLAAFEDYLVGDPWGWLHPVQVIGWIIQQYTELTLKLSQIGWQRRLAGVLLGLGLIVGSAIAGWLLVWSLSLIEPIFGDIAAIIILASCFAGKSLRVAVEDVLEPLGDREASPAENRNLAEARSRLSLYVGRDTDNLSESEILRALLETIAENTVDGVTAPLFYAILGSFSGIGAVPLALAYKAASTLDSMVGYRREPYSDLGWFSAQLEDRLTWVPCRLTVLTLSLFSGRPLQVLAICLRDGVRDPSPNSGWSEAVYAGILKVQLGGKNTYQGKVKEKPLLGDDLEPISIAKIELALALTRYCFLTWLAIASCISLV
jgi:adenosylcobinamide-phosphate synthase